MMMNDLKDMITEYLQAVEKGLKLFEQKIGRRDILAAWHEGALPREGKLLDDVEYELHGIGCWLSFPEYEIDFDFGPNGRSDGFDLWKLNKYVKQFAERFPALQKAKQLEATFEQLKIYGIITQKYPQQSSLYFLN